MTAAITIRTRTSVPMKNWTATNNPRTTPVATGRRRCRTRSSSRQATISGGIGAMPSIRWASVRLIRMNGEKP